MILTSSPLEFPRALGIDPNASRFLVARSVAERHGLDVRLERGRMQALELPDDSFDIAVMNNTLCYVVDPAERLIALREAARVLRLGGWLVIRNPNALGSVNKQGGGIGLVA